MLRVFPALKGARIEYAWSGLMSYARHQMPQIGSDGEGLWWAQAFGGHGLAPTCAAGELLAAAIAEGDTSWKQFADYGLASTFKPFGFVGAQANYWWQEFNDWFKTSLEG
jgi:gamma-glutamylputrescine oxidase